MDYKARLYDPALGRFLQPDTIVPGAGNPQNFNRYSYVGNSPIVFNDPTGHMQACEAGDVCKHAPSSPIPNPNPPSGGGGHGGHEPDDEDDIPVPVTETPIQYGPPTPPGYYNGVTINKDIDMYSANPPYVEFDPAYWRNPILLAIGITGLFLNSIQFLRANTNLLPAGTIPSELHYYYGADGVRTSDPHGVILDRLSINNTLSEGMAVNITTQLYKGDTPMPQRSNKLTVDSSSTGFVLTSPKGYSTDFTKIVITLNLRSESYTGQIQYTIPTWYK